MPNEANTAFNIGDIVFQVFSLLFIALIVTIVVIAIRMIKIRELTGFFCFHHDPLSLLHQKEKDT